jgi:hypothetical protein
MDVAMAISFTYDVPGNDVPGDDVPGDFITSKGLAP